MLSCLLAPRKRALYRARQRRQQPLVRQGNEWFGNGRQQPMHCEPLYQFSRRCRDTTYADSDHRVYTIFCGKQGDLLAARDSGTGNTEWQTMGTHGVPPLPSNFPNPLSMNPSAGTSQNAMVALTFQDAANGLNLQTGWALINTAIDGRSGCYMAKLSSPWAVRYAG